MVSGNKPSRRELIAAGAALTSSLLIATKGVADSGKKGSSEAGEDEVSPVEDLMREHGLLRRILLIYDEGMARLQNKQDFDWGVVHESARIVRTFMEEYHEKLEEEYVFPKFEKAGKQLDLVKVLREQHAAGRKITSQILELPEAGLVKDARERAALMNLLHSFERMYRPHAAREDTVLFPDFRGIVGEKQYEALGEIFEEKEHQLFGAAGFRGMVARVGALEEKLGIHNLSHFTPS